MPRSKISDLLGILKGMQSVVNALIKYQESAITYKITHCSLKNSTKQCIQITGKKLSNIEPIKISVSLLIVD